MLGHSKRDGLMRNVREKNKIFLEKVKSLENKEKKNGLEEKTDKQ